MVKSGQVCADAIVCKDGTGALATPSVGPAGTLYVLSLIHISEPTRPYSISYAVFCLKTQEERKSRHWYRLCPAKLNY